MSVSELRSSPMYRATNRTLLVLGGERNLMLMLMIVCFGLVFTGLTVGTTLLGLGGWAVGTAVLRLMASKDQMLSKVFFRYWNVYRRRVYPATSRPGAPGYLSRNR